MARQPFLGPIDAGRPILAPEPGWWTLRVVKGGPLVPARIWLVHTIAEPGEPANRMERSPFLAAEIAGDIVDVDKVWLSRGTPISEAEYRFRVKDAAWCREHQPDQPIANPTRKVDWMQAPLPF